MVREISLSKVCCVNCVKTFDATRLLSVAVQQRFVIQIQLLVAKTFRAPF